MKTKEELNTIKEEYENLNRKLSELTEVELKQVTGGTNEYDEMIIKSSKESYNEYFDLVDGCMKKEELVGLLPRDALVCPKCNNALLHPRTEHGVVTCSCGAEVIY